MPMSLEWLGFLAAQTVFLLGLLTSYRSRVRESEIEHFDFWFGERVMELIKDIHVLAEKYSSFPPGSAARDLNVNKVHQLISLLENTRSEYYRVVVEKKPSTPNFWLELFEHDHIEAYMECLERLCTDFEDEIRVGGSPRLIADKAIQIEENARELSKVIRRRLIASKGLFHFYFFRRKDFSINSIKRKQ